MGRRNKRLAKNRAKEQAKKFLKLKVEKKDFSGLSEEEKRLEIAHCANLILSSPEMNLHKLEDLFSLSEDESKYISALAICSLSAIFIDIIPGYEIKMIDSKQQVSQEIKALRIYEEKLLFLYFKYLEFLESNINLKGTAKCVSNMLEHLCHFNYRDKLVDLALLALSRDPSSVISSLQASLQSPDLDFRVAAIKKIHQFLKHTSCKLVPEELIGILGSVQIYIPTEEDKPKKRSREERDEEEIDDQKKASMNRLVLQEILAIIFRILKQFPKSELVPPALKVLLKLIPILSTEIVLDIIKHLVSMLEEKQKNSIYILRTAIAIMTKSKQAINIEERSFAVMLYNSLTYIPIDYSSQRAYVKALTWLLLERKQYSFEMVCSFIKRMLQVAFHCPEDLSKSLIALVKIVFSKYPRCMYLLEDEGSDSYLGEVEDPYLTNAGSSNILYEMKALEFLPDKEIKSMLKAIREPKISLDRKPADFLKRDHDKKSKRN